MGIIEESENQTKDIDIENLIELVNRKKSEGWRIIQICCSDDKDNYWLYYSFGDKFGFIMETYRIKVTKDKEIPSITMIYPYAYLYENEMKELFGVKIERISVDYNNRFYRIKAEAPFRRESKNNAK